MDKKIFLLIYSNRPPSPNTQRKPPAPMNPNPSSFAIREPPAPPMRPNSAALPTPIIPTYVIIHVFFFFNRKIEFLFDISKINHCSERTVLF